jgi:ATP-binding cassette subfamily F protein uup
MPAVIEVKNLSKSIGVLELFKDVNFSIETGAKTGLIAKNGIGKTTLLNILAGNEDYNSGTIRFLPDFKIGYLSQEPQISEESDILNAIFHTQNPTLNLIKDYESALDSNNTALIEKLTLQIDNQKAWDFENKVRQILSQLGIHDLNQKVKELSGGQKKRVALASILVEDPDVLILDEPTNHLDIKAISWLEEYLKRSSVTLLMVTHDRYFLDRVCNVIFELDNLSLYTYSGNYSYFLDKRLERIELMQKAIDKAENLLRKEEEWMRRMPKARSTKAKYRIDNYYDLKDKASQTIREDKVKINIAGNRLGSKILVADNVNFSWGDKKYLRDFSHTFSRFEKIGILGENGCGKSTFLDVLTGTLKPESGKIETGETIKFGHYQQQGMVFDQKMKVIDAVTQVAETITLGDGKILTAMQFLNHFLFPPNRQYDYIYKLSGGEKRRLYLCTVLMQNPNFLILDEPTNDLDIATLEVLEEYLHDFAGCVMVVSHDRYFLDEVVDHVFVFEGDGKIKDFPGNYTQYYSWKLQNDKEIQAKKQPEKKEREKTQSDQKKLSFKEKFEYEQLAAEIDNLEKEKSVIEQQLSSGELSGNDLISKSKRIGELIGLISYKTDRWLELAEKAGE